MDDGLSASENGPLPQNPKPTPEESDRRLGELRHEIALGIDEADRGELLDGEAVMSELIREVSAPN